MTEQTAIEQLSQYRQKQARIQVLSTYSVGAGITVSRLNEDDQLQELHRQLRGRPSYMYLSEREQRLEQTANAYMTWYPAGVKAQKRAVPDDVMDPEDRKLLQELRDKIQKVIAARGYDVRSDIDDILDRLTKLQDLQADVNRIDTVLKALEGYKPEYAKLIWLHFIDKIPWDEAAKALNVSRPVFYRWRKKALEEYEKLAK
ncbi:RNA polymerase subunit sigma-24 [Fontibacillus sp. BL9]|uniref:RNA polymerase subunit sigma-24 n=1 Tax=Fontibacillus sp. BL9 TaxID=3389971 RepID=UPI00397BDC42